ncbi:MAG: glycosyltransferase [bacterium]|nr:glycosyltransferase [bacterium]
MDNKEKNFISAVVYLHNDSEKAITFFDALTGQLDWYFEKYELVAVNDACTDNTVDLLRSWSKELNHPVTIVHMSLYHGTENAMTAGIDAAIGDYVFEFDSVRMNYDIDLIIQAYRKALDGNDIVCVCPTRTRATSRLFYSIFNNRSMSGYRIQTDVFRLVTRRAINRVNASNSFMPYRKAAYAASGLKMEFLTFEGKVRNRQKARFSLAINSLTLYTDTAFRVSMAITVFMMLLAVAALVYTIVTYSTGKSVRGWTTTMLVMTFGFFGLFALLSILIKYASLNLYMGFRKQKYLIENVEKIQKSRAK